MGLLDLFKRKRAPAPAANPVRTRQAILRLVQYAQDPELRQAALEHLVSNLSKSRKESFLAPPNLDPGLRVDRGGLLCEFLPAECVHDQEFLFAVATSHHATEDRIIATTHLVDQTQRARIALSELDERVGLAALELILDQDLIVRVVTHARSAAVCRKALLRITDEKVIKRLATKRSFAFRWLAIELVDDQRLLNQAVFHDPEYSVRSPVLDRITDPSTLGRVASRDEDPHLRKRAVAMIDDQRVIARIAIGDPDPSVRLAAIGKLDDERALAKVASSDVDLDVREAAASRLSDAEMLASIASARDARRSESHSAVMERARQFLRSLPVEKDARVPADHWRAGDGEAVIKVLDELGRFDDAGAEDPGDVWDRIAPTFCDPITGQSIDEARFLIDVRHYSEGSESFKEVTWLLVERFGEDEYTWSEVGGTFDG